MGVKKTRISPEVAAPPRQFQGDESDVLVFYDRKTGAAQFRAQSAAGQPEGMERAASLLAIQCLVRGHDPENFVVLVPAEETLSRRLVVRARELLDEGRAIAGPAPLSPRQKEILHSVMRNLANKEIASRLNITVRTVKFHISALLSKFGVQSRGELALKAASVLGMMDFYRETPEYDTIANYPTLTEPRPMPMGAAMDAHAGSRALHLRTRILPA
jgi:DNA-binding CsgD family transcriptional regulator